MRISSAEPREAELPAQQVGQSILSLLTQSSGSFGPFQHVKYLGPLDETAYAPFMLWLTQTCQPRFCAQLGLGDGSIFFSMCQAADRLDRRPFVQGTAIASEGTTKSAVPQEILDHMSGRYENLASLKTTPPDRAMQSLRRKSVDLLVLRLVEFEHAAPEPEEIRDVMSPAGVIVLLGTDRVAPDGRAAELMSALSIEGRMFRMSQADGVCMLIGTDAPSVIQTLTRLHEFTPEHTRIRHVFERLGMAAASDRVRKETPARRRAEEARALEVTALEAALTAARADADALEALQDRMRAQAAERERELVALISAARTQAGEATQRALLVETYRMDAEKARDRALAACTTCEEKMAWNDTRHVQEIVALVERIQQNEEEAFAALDREKTLHRQEVDALQDRLAELETARNWMEVRAELMRVELEARHSSKAGLKALFAGRGWPSRSKQVAILLASKHFDPAWYRERHGPTPDSTPAQLARDYLERGTFAGDNPSPSFNTKAYYLSNPDVSQSGMNALVHYEMFGKAEQRSIVAAESRP